MHQETLGYGHNGLLTQWYRLVFTSVVVNVVWQNQTAEVSQGHQEKCRISFSMSVLAAVEICYVPGNIGLWTQWAVDAAVRTCIYIGSNQCDVAKSKS